MNQGWIIQFRWSKDTWITIKPDPTDRWSGGVYHTQLIYPFKSQALEIARWLPKMHNTVTRVIPVQINSKEQELDDVFVAA